MIHLWAELLNNLGVQVSLSCWLAGEIYFVKNTGGFGGSGINTLPLLF
jgi:hypothetical protein